MNGAVREPGIVSIGPKDESLPVFVAVTLEAFPDGGSVVERTTRRREGQIRLVVLADGLEKGTRVGRRIVVVLRPLSGGRREVHVRVLFGVV